VAVPQRRALFDPTADTVFKSPPPRKRQSKKAAAPSVVATKYTARKYTSGAIKLQGIVPGFARANLLFECVDHSEASFEARIFVNNPDAGPSTLMNLDSGYAGRFHIFGHGGCFGDVGHCEIRGPRRSYDPRPQHALTPANKTVIATDAIRRTLTAGRR
jgi:hypothetical protein